MIGRCVCNFSLPSGHFGDVQRLSAGIRQWHLSDLVSLFQVLRIQLQWGSVSFGACQHFSAVADNAECRLTASSLTFVPIVIPVGEFIEAVHDLPIDIYIYLSSPYIQAYAACSRAGIQVNASKSALAQMMLKISLCWSSASSVLLEDKISLVVAVHPQTFLYLDFQCGDDSCLWIKIDVSVLDGVVLCELGRVPLQLYWQKMLLKYVSRISEFPSDRLVKKAFTHASSVNTLWWQKLSLWLSQHRFEGVLAEWGFFSGQCWAVCKRQVVPWYLPVFSYKGQLFHGQHVHWLQCHGFLPSGH